MVLSTRFMVAVKLYLYKCLHCVCKCHVGLFRGLSLSRYKHGKLLSITWTFSSFPQSAFFFFPSLTFSTFKLRWPLWFGTFSAAFFLPSSPPFYSFYLAQTVTTAHARLPSDQSGTLMYRVPSSSLLLWHRGLWARPSKCWRHLHLMCMAASRVGGGDGATLSHHHQPHHIPPRLLHDTSWKQKVPDA